MGIITSSLTTWWLTRHNRRVQEWLQNATSDSVLEALTSVFYKGSAGYGPLLLTLPDPERQTSQESGPKSIFDAYGSLDETDKKRYWSEKDLRDFLSNLFPICDALDASIPILWRCFHFYAYFPFPQKSSQRLDYSAFQRVVALLAADGTSRLGSDAIGATVEKYRNSFRGTQASNNLWLMFRSLATRSSHMIGPKDTECGQAELSVEEDLLDVLALVQPADPCITAVQGDELRPHTSRILDSSEGYVYTLIPRKDLFSLLKLLLSIEIDKPKWGDRFYTGHAPSTSPDPDILNRVTDAVLRRFTQDEESDVNWQTFKDALSVSFPHLLSQFRLIFTTFISSSPSPKVEAPNTLPSTSIFSIPHMQYLSFFYPPPAAPATVHGYTGYISPFHQFARPEAHYYLQNPKLVYSASPSTLSTIDLARILVPMRDQSILLLTGDILAASNAHGPNNPLERVTLGAYIPTPWDINGERSFKVGPAHTLFQLEPRHEHLRAQKPEAWISDLISIDTDTDTEQNRKGALRFGAKGGSGLSIDFDAGTATLKSMAVTGDSANKEENTEQDIGYQDANTAGEGPGWETRVRIDKLEVYQLDGPRAMTLQTVSELSARAETLGLFSY